MSNPYGPHLADFTESDDPDHEVAKRGIVKRLRAHHRGRENAVASKTLAEGLPVSASTVRDLVREVRQEFGVPIGSANGYFIIEDLDEMERQIERQLEQAETAKQTARDITAAWNQK